MGERPCEQASCQKKSALIDGGGRVCIINYNFTSLSFDVNILVLCTIFIKFFTNSTSFIQKYMLKTTITMDGVFFVLDCVRCQWTKLCWNEFCV